MSVPTPGDAAPAPGPLPVPVPGLHALPPTRLVYQPDVLVRSFVLERAAGNVAVYNSPGLGPAVRRSPALGPVDRLLINHAHEAMYGEPGLGAAASVHERDRAETARSMRVAGVFTGRQTIDDDLEVIPTPGHTAGTTSYLWDSGAHRCLFTGDFVWIEHGEWKAVVLDPALRSAYLDSLALVRELDFDVLVPWGTSDDGAPYVVTDRAGTRRRIDAISARVRDGGNR